MVNNSATQLTQLSLHSRLWCNDSKNIVARINLQEGFMLTKKIPLSFVLHQTTKGSNEPRSRKILGYLFAFT